MQCTFNDEIHLECVMRFTRELRCAPPGAKRAYLEERVNQLKADYADYPKEVSKAISRVSQAFARG